MRVAIIGATGNAGTELLRRLHIARRDGADLQITGIARRMPDPSIEPYNDVDWHSVDIGAIDGRERLARALTGADAVVHLAWVLQPNHDLARLYRTNVNGTRNALQATADAGVRHFVCASSMAAYSPARTGQHVSERWPTQGIASSHYSRHKAEQEHLLDEFEREHPEISVARVRPALIFHADASSEIHHYFLGRLIPRPLIRFALKKLPLPILPIPDSFAFQVVHGADVADVYWRVLDQRADGAFNVAAEPVITPERLGGLLGAKRVLNVPVSLYRALVAISWRLRLQQTDEGWIDMASLTPLLNTDRAHHVLGWAPKHSAPQALQELLDGMGNSRSHAGSPALDPYNEHA
ncbi:NAD-dependent epimerase/dehydratase family protein [Arthrobacter roseus]|uniref:NAD-dependent epimerase/dehydratase family protein n=1 Tax=Arthrobacter roseus TaxID=136274 RepID=UPI00196257BD|nr:NAD-dependent epimerase/dehydratase family protein [Arthrobacter roseus]MBM7849756.1 nucleoside-diphosphate-sugar epimerase [Arthrobacter roseus]